MKQRPRTRTAHVHRNMPQPCMRSIIAFLDGGFSMPDFKCRYGYWTSYRILQMAALCGSRIERECTLRIGKGELHGGDAAYALAAITANDLSILYRLDLDADNQEMMFVRAISHAMLRNRRDYDPDQLDAHILAETDRSLPPDANPSIKLGGFVHNTKQVAGTEWKQDIAEHGEDLLDRLWEYCQGGVS